jgi:hypothetical protein
MTRQVAIGAVIAFAATVLLFSVWTPSQPPAPPPPAPPVATPVLSKDIQIKQVQLRPLPGALVNKALLVKNGAPAGDAAIGSADAGAP